MDRMEWIGLNGPNMTDLIEEDRMDQNLTEWELDRVDLTGLNWPSGPYGPNWTELAKLDRIDLSRPNEPKWTE